MDRTNSRARHGTTRGRPALAAVAILVSAVAAVAAGGCTTTSVDGDHATDGVNRQRYDFETVKVRAKRLQKGMTTLDVSMLLGSPAQVRGERWYYRPSKAGPGQVLRVTFDGNVLKEWGYEPLILGEMFR
ncbi:MAG: outer membrane protein assembly factor BamE domain-containing protein [Planctomycetota bacterium]|jgi:outer membrane protein assembly factor BamE (lipoprotein component of BamABCDE complex)